MFILSTCLNIHFFNRNVLLVHVGDNILTALSVGRECELVKPDQTVIRVEAELQTDQYSPHLNVSYTLEENEKTNIVHDVSNNADSDKAIIFYIILDIY